jgi:ribosome-binding factor A
MSVRTERVASVLKEELGTLFQREFRMEQYGMITVTEVRVSPDLREAKVYVSIFGDDERKRKSLKMLEDQRPFIRTELGRAVRLRFTPDVTFFLDDSLDRAMKLENIIKKIHEDERGRAGDGAENE